MFIALILGELLLLFLLTRRLTRNLFTALFLLTGSRVWGISIISAILFPGTVIHELAHLFTAEILGVRTGGLTLVPEGLEENQVRAGSVMIAQTDPVRRAVIGIAPVLVGMGALFTLSWFLPGMWEQTRLDMANGIALSQPSFYFLLFAFYILFAISNTMFASKEDMEGFWPVAVVVGILLLSGYLVGVRLTLDPMADANVYAFLTTLATTLGWIVGSTLILFFGSILGIRSAERLTNRRMIKQ